MNKYKIRNQIVKSQSCILEKASTLFSESSKLYDHANKYDGHEMSDIQDFAYIENMIAKDLIHVWHWLENLSDEVLKEE